MLSAAAEFGIKLEAYITTLLSWLDSNSIQYKLNELEEELLAIIGAMNEDTLRPVITNLIADLNAQLAPLLWPRDLHITNKSFISTIFTVEADILPLPIGGTVPSKYSDEIRLHSVGVCGNGTHVKLNYLGVGGVVEDSTEFDITYQLADWTNIDIPNEPGYPHQWRWISAFQHDMPTIRYGNRPIYRSAEIGVRELSPHTDYTGFNVSADVSVLSGGSIMHDIGIVYDTPSDESCIIAKAV